MKEKEPITEVTIENFLKYQRDNSKREINTRFAIGIGTVVMGFTFVALGVGIYHHRANGDLAEKIAYVLGGCLIIGAFIYIVGTANQQWNQPWESNFTLLEAWEKLTRYPAREFPLYPGQKALLEEWAKHDLKNFAIDATRAFSLQAAARDNFANPRASDEKHNPASAAQAVAGLRRRVRMSDEEAKKHHDRFLAYWDLVTEKGAGILTGEEWSDPEVYRKRLIETGRKVPVLLT